MSTGRLRIGIVPAHGRGVDQEAAVFGNAHHRTARRPGRDAALDVGGLRLGFEGGGERIGLGRGNADQLDGGGAGESELGGDAAGHAAGA